MITSSSIQYISRVLAEPEHISEADKESIAALTQAYPYFVPARYMEAANEHKKQPYSGPMMSMMQLYMGNWLLYCQFLQSAMGGQEPVPAPPQATVPQQPAEPEQNGTIVPPAAPEQVITPVVANALAETLPVEEPVPVPPQPEQTETIEAVVPETEQNGTIAEEAPSFDAPPQLEKIEETQPEPVVETHTPQQKPLPEHPLTEDNEAFILPIYTEDYFLHQGMHVSNNIPADLPGVHDEGKQLMVVMSFSEWLNYFKTRKQKEADEEEDRKAVKTMWQKEKLAAALEEENDEIPEKVFEMAVNSITKEDDLVSESLAEIHFMQGRHDKAIEMYRKLSLRNPQKKAYFARKIEIILKEKQS